jgi:hypothetical protein
MGQKHPHVDMQQEENGNYESNNEEFALMID